ncbi:MAG: hypothetical protein BGN96_02155 [Bacteroidales bacterium 45-6]|nr:MAG: hypothetical protein BGN96_02155 [Bacteroidales bacterium 45-6]
MAFASPEIIRLFNKVKYPYNVNQLTQEFVLNEIEQVERKQSWVKTLLDGRAFLTEQLKSLGDVLEIYPTDANFVLVKVTDANGIYAKLADSGVIVRNRNSVTLCGNCLRITVGTEEENKELIDIWRKLGI